MAKFPTKDADVLALAHEIMNGLAHHEEVFPAPPVPFSNLAILNNAALQAIAEMINAEAVYARAVSKKQAAMKALSGEMPST